SYSGQCTAHVSQGPGPVSWNWSAMSRKSNVHIHGHVQPPSTSRPVTNPSAPQVLQPPEPTPPQSDTTTDINGIHLWNTRGFKVHKRKADETWTLGRHTKVTHPQLAQHTEHWGHCLPDEEDIPESPEADGINEFRTLRCGSPDYCYLCKTSPATIRCDKCFGVNMYCPPCILSLHEKNPLHRLKEWTGECFEKRTLRDFGLCIQLGHAVGESSEKLCTAATFSLLEMFHLLSFESKVSSYEFYNLLTRCSDNTGLLPKNDRYEQFLRMSQEWRHLKLLKQSGCRHDPAGIANTEEGACAVLCPACPQPRKNLPAHWDKAPKEKSWLYGLFVAIDVNFRLKRRAVLKDSVDPSLSQGWAYFVAEAAYKSHLKKHLNQPQEKSTCASHNAVNMADKKSSKGLAATGVGTVDCAQHGMKLPCGVGNLQKGEKYINMYYLFFSSQRNTTIKTLNISYDIVCQWHKGLWAHMSTLPLCLQLKYQQMLISFLVPKFHLPAHIAQCQWEFSFNWQLGVARTDGEAPERGWADINRVASSTKQMGPGHRQDILDDHFRDWNWKKLVGLGALLLCKIQEAIPERNEHQDDFDELTQSLQDRYPDLLVKWKHEVEEWETDQKKPNPFEVRTESFTQASVRLQLARDEAKAVLSATLPPLHPDVSPSILISTGIELDDQRRRLCTDLAKLGQHATDLQKTKIQQRSNGLLRRLEAWAKIQTLFIPGVAALRDAVTETTGNNPPTPEDFALHLPSQICHKVACSPELEEIEWKLREGQWKHEVEEWETDQKKPNLFEVRTESRDEAKAALSTTLPPLHPDVSPSILISTGIELDDQWLRLCADLAKLRQHAMDLQKTKIQQCSNGLLRCLEAWAKIQTLFIPGVAALRDAVTETTGDNPPTPEDFALHLPSQICSKVACSPELEEIEWKLREGQAHDALNELQQALHSRTYILKFKDRFLRGQGANTCAHNCLKSVDDKINASASKYRAVHHTLLTLSSLLGKVGWKSTFNTLADDDIRGMSDGVDGASTEG
ncbi:hypothetical protein BDN67DRAFT_982034, partial [Paxillus ammoniavirescens]